MLVERTAKRNALFWDKVNHLEGDDACWEWVGAKNDRGYGWITVSVDGKQQFHYAHRVSFEWHVRELLPGEIVRHRCDNPSCIRPTHLLVGTHQENMDDMVERGRHVGNRDLTVEQVVTIRERRAGGASTVQLGADYSVSPQHISSICTGRFWPDAGGPLTRKRQ